MREERWRDHELLMRERVGKEGRMLIGTCEGEMCRVLTYMMLLTIAV